jgi:seryl-tRNA synthetase
MIHINDIRENPEIYQQAIKRKRLTVDVNALLELDDRRRALQAKIDELRQKRNNLSEATKTIDKDCREEHLAQCKAIAEKLAEAEQQLRPVKEQYTDMMLRVPGIPADDVPDGETDAENKEIRKWGQPTSFGFTPKDHLELARMHGIAAFEAAREIAGARAFALVGDGALLELAVLRFALDKLLAKNYIPVLPPLMVREQAMIGTGYFPIGEEQAYKLERDELYLAGTSEVGVVALHANQVLQREDLPLRYAGVSACFRREAGAAGKDTKGLYRVHQFQKVEQVVICGDDAEETAREHAQLLANAEEILQALELPYRVVVVCAGDMGLGQVRKHDLEAWMPSRNAYGETHSCSTLNAFQARRLNIRFMGENGEKRHVHTLNNTAIASPRILIPLLEVHQQEDGRVRIPVALRPYMGGREYLEPRANPRAGFV